MKEDKLIIFDWGGVIESHNSQEYNVTKATLDFFKSFGINMSDEAILKKYYECCNSDSVVNNKEELFNAIKKQFDLKCDLEEYTTKYNKYLSKVDYYQEVVNFAHSLKNKCQIGILSNLTPFDKKRLDDQVDLSKFDYVWLSFELNCRKPNPKIYDMVNKEIPISSKNILFIDDLEKNLEIPKIKGWHTCQGVGTELSKIKQYVEEFLKNK